MVFYSFFFSWCSAHSVNLLFHLLSFLLDMCFIKDHFRVFIFLIMSVKAVSTLILLFLHLSVLLIFSILLATFLSAWSSVYLQCSYLYFWYFEGSTQWLKIFAFRHLEVPAYDAIHLSFINYRSLKYDRIDQTCFSFSKRLRLFQRQTKSGYSFTFTY